MSVYVDSNQTTFVIFFQYGHYKLTIVNAVNSYMSD